MATIAFYGSLMRSFDTQTKLNIRHQLQFIQPCTLHGALYDLGDYPGLKHGTGRVKAELYEILDPRVMTVLDQFEEYQPDHHQASLYTRSCVRLAAPNVDSWVYFYNQAVSVNKRIPSGDWLHFHTNSD